MSFASSRTPMPSPATLEDLLAIPEEDRFHEILDGELVEKHAAHITHGYAQGELAVSLRAYRGKPNGPTRPGGWWFATETTVRLSPHQIVRPDIAGWRRERFPELPKTFPVELRPDWVCEVCADRNARRRDSLQKRRIYAEHGVPYYWILDLVEERLVVFQLVEGMYQEILEAGRSERICAPPFEALELPIGALFGDDVE